MSSTFPDPAPADAPAESAFRRQRNRPMRGCLRTIFFSTVVVLLLLFLIVGGFWSWTGTSNFAEYVRVKIERNLEAKLGRDVTIGRVTFVRSRPQKIILDDVRIANLPGSTRPYFARARQVEITGGIQSFWKREIRVGRIDVRDPALFVEIFPEGRPFLHNFPRWKRSQPRRFEITRLDISKLFVTGGSFEFLDRRRDMTAHVQQLSSEVTPIFRRGIYQGLATSPVVRLQIQKYQPILMTLRGGFYYRPGSLSLKTIALRGTGIETFVSGKLEPLTEAVYDFGIDSRIELARVRSIFGVAKPLDGSMTLHGRLRGKRGDFELSGDYRVPELTADVYQLGDVEGSLNITDAGTKIHVASARYGGGTISGDYRLSKYGEPYPMETDLAFNRVSLEKLFEDWGVAETGLRGAATGQLTYGWNKDDLLSGSGEGSARLAPGAVAFGRARYPMPLSGRTDFSLDQGVIGFRSAALSTPKSNVTFSGSMAIEELDSNLVVNVRSNDFSELDKIAYNFARATGKEDAELLGLGGSGTIRGTVKGPLGSPLVVAHVSGNSTRYNDVLLGSAEIDLRYDGPKSLLTFERSVFNDGGATLAMTGTIAFPDRGPSPRFDLRIAADGYDVERALSIVNLELEVAGLGTGTLHVTGTPDVGQVHFEPLTIARGDARLRLNGLVAWAPGEGNVRFDLDIGANDFPVEDIIAFLDLGSIPATGRVTGTLHLEGKKASLEGAGSITLRDGSLFGERVDTATADLAFTAGKMRVTHAEVRSPAGFVTGEAEVDFATERFSYIVRSSDIDVTKLQALSGIANLFGGRLKITSSGAGTFDQPELVLEGTLDEARLEGADFPEGAPPPQFYVAIREGQLVIRADAFGVVTAEGAGVVTNGAIAGNVRINVIDIAKAFEIFRPQMDIPATGRMIVDLELGGRISPIDQLVVNGTVPLFELNVSDRPLRAAEPIRFGYRNGRIDFHSFNLQVEDSTFSVAGHLGVTGDRSIDLRVRGLVEAALIRFFTPDIRADGRLLVAAGVTGTLDSPVIRGSAEFQNAEVKLSGFPQLIEGVTGSLVFRGDRVELDSLRARLGGGNIVAGGFITLDGLKPGRVRLNLQGTDVSIRYFEGITVDGDVSLILSGDAERMVLQGDVQLDRALYYKDFDFTTSLLNLLLERRGILPEVAASWQDKVTLRINVRAPEALAVRNNIADVTGSAELELLGTLANPVVLGLVSIDEGGKVRFQDVDYRVVRGSINFQNPFRIDPFFDITAEGRLQEYDLTINLTGTLDRITPTITSDPPVSDLTLLTLLSPQIGGASTARFQADSFQTAGTSLLLQSVGELIGSRILPFADSFRFDPGLLDTEGDAEPKVTFEKQINRDLRVIVVYNTANQHNREIIEWQVTSDWVLQLTRDSEIGDTYLINAVDARFRRRYEGRW